MKYLDYLEKKDDITTTEGESVEVFELKGGMDPETLEEWAISYRQNYCGDDILDLLVKGTGLTKEEYLLTHKFPDKTEGFGPGTRSGDFAELLIADYLEFCLGYTVHRERYKNKFNRSSSTQGTDVIGFKMLGTKDSTDDELVTFEVKAQASGTKPTHRLQDAIDDSFKDPVRKGETLSALKQLYIEKDNLSKALKVERFQNKPDRPYIERYGSAAIYDTKTFSEATIKEVSVNGCKRWLIVMHRNNLMELVHELYKRAAQC